MKKSFMILMLFIFTLCISAQEYKTGNVIFIHPDGTGLSTWNATRILYYGPDGELNWDKLPNVGLYKSHMANSISAASHAGATIHAYGIKVIQDSYGMNGEEELTSLSGKKQSIMHEAHNSGMLCGLINSGSIIEPGTGAFVASVPSRSIDEEITEKIIKSGVDIIMSGGEDYMLPKEETGFHKGTGKRTDGQNLINWAKENGYTVVYTKDQLADLPSDVTKVLGVFSAGHTFNDKTEEYLAEAKLTNYNPVAPTLAEMTSKALEIFSNKNKQFFLVIEEEATDNFANKNNANGTLEALKRADDAIGVTIDFIDKNPNTLLITAADSEAGGMLSVGNHDLDPNKSLEDQDENGSPIDGRNGTGSLPFISAPDKNGNRLPYYIGWSSFSDGFGSVVSRADGLNAQLLKGTIDNTEIYRIMYATLFGTYLK